LLTSNECINILLFVVLSCSNLTINHLLLNLSCSYQGIVGSMLLDISPKLLKISCINGSDLVLTRSLKELVDQLVSALREFMLLVNNRSL